MKRLFAALRFFTILPLPAGWCGGERELGASLPMLPVVGLLIGLLVAYLDTVWGQFLPRPVASVLVVIALLGVSGGLHLDGLADAADGFLSSRPRETVLEIMRDSRSGAMAIMAVVCVLSLKIAALASIPLAGARWAALVLMPLAGRCAIVVHLAILPYARPEGGLASVFVVRRPWLECAWAAALLGLAGWWAAGGPGLAAGAASLLAALALAFYSQARIGGRTGDTLGASCELVEVVPALLAAAWVHGGAA